MQEILVNVNDTTDSIYLISKWGFDGSSGQSEYKQSFQFSTANDDASLFVTSLVPIKSIFGHPDEKHKTIWQNQRPCSPRYCRPIRLQFVHETTQVLKEEYEYISNRH